MNKYALITGGTKGIGKAVASLLAQSGYHLILTYATDQEAADAVSESIRAQYNVKVYALSADVTDKVSIDLIDSFLKEQAIQLDTVVMNAGLTLRDSFEEMNLSDWERIFFANIHFPVFLIQRIVSRIKAGGSVVFTGSLMGIHPHGIGVWRYQECGTCVG